MTTWRVALEGRDSQEDAGADAQTFAVRESLGYLVNRAARIMAGELAVRIRPTGVGVGQWAILLLLWARDGATQAELARRAAIEAPTVVRTIDRMVRDGLVQRAGDPGDARLSRIYLTDRGRALQDELIPHAVAVNNEVLSRLSPAEGDHLRRLLAKLIEPPA